MEIGYRSILNFANVAENNSVAVQIVERWLTASKRAPFPRVPKVPREVVSTDAGDTLTRTDAPGAVRWTVEEHWTVPKNALRTGDNRTARTTLTLATDGLDSQIWIEVRPPSVIRLSPSGQEVEETMRAAIPNVARELVDGLELSDGDFPVMPEPIIITQRQVPELIAGMENERRTGAIIVFAPDPSGDADQSLIASAARKTLGYATVVLLESSAVEDFNREIGATHRVLRGGARTYLPSVLFGVRADAIRHLTLFPETMKQSAHGRLLDILQRGTHAQLMEGPLGSNLSQVDRQLRVARTQLSEPRASVEEVFDRLVANRVSHTRAAQARREPTEFLEKLERIPTGGHPVNPAPAADLTGEDTSTTSNAETKPVRNERPTVLQPGHTDADSTATVPTQPPEAEASANPLDVDAIADAVALRIAELIQGSTSSPQDASRFEESLASQFEAFKLDFLTEIDVPDTSILERERDDAWHEWERAETAAEDLRAIAIEAESEAAILRETLADHALRIEQMSSHLLALGNKDSEAAARGYITSDWASPPTSFEALSERLTDISSLHFGGDMGTLRALDSQMAATGQSALRAAWNALMTFDAYVRARRKKLIDCDLRAYMEDTSHGLTMLVPSPKWGESKTVRSNPQLADARRARVPRQVDASESFMITAHVPLATHRGTSPRLYFYDAYSQAGVVCLGHIGGHLDSATTN